MILQRILASIVPPQPRQIAPSDAGRRLSECAQAKRRAARTEVVRKHCAALLASMPNRTDPST